MKTNLKQKFLRTAMGGIGALMLLSAPSAFAFPTSGTCAMLVTRPVPYGQTLPASGDYNVLATLTFTSATAGTVHFHTTGVTYSTTRPVVSAADSLTTPAAGLPFTVAAGPIPGSKAITLDPTGPEPIIANMYAVNGDKTILVQGANDLFSGVCQF